MTKKMNDWIVPILFLLLPFVFLAPGLIWKSQLLFFLICPIFIIALDIKNIWIKSFLLYASAWQMVVFALSFNKAGMNPGYGLSIILALMAGALIFKFVSEGKVADEKWFMCIRIAVILQILISLPQTFGWNPFADFMALFIKVRENLPGHLVGSLGNRNYLASFIAISIPCFVEWRIFNIGKIPVNPAIVVIFAFLFACFSPGTLAAIIGVGFLLSYNLSPLKRLISMSLAVKAAVIFTAFYVLTTGNHLWEFKELPGQLIEFLTTGKFTVDPFKADVGRFAMWMMALSQLITGWFFMIFGFGPGAFWGREYSMHGQYMSVWFQFGLVGLGLMIGYIVTTFRFLTKEKNLILLTSFLIICLDMIGNFPVEIASTAFLIVIICGLIERRRLNG
jgi:hypothetical protein